MNATPAGTNVIRRTVKCPHCNIVTSHRLVLRYQRWGDFPSCFDADIKERLEDLFMHNNERGEVVFWGYNSYYLAICESCLELVLYVNRPPHDDIVECFEGSDDYPTTLEWPKEETVSPHLPDTVAQLYEEALRTKPASLSSFAVGVRRTLEAIADDTGYNTGPLASRLQQMALANVLPPVVQEIATVLRVLGNKGAHYDEDITLEEANTLSKFLQLLIEYLYVVPAELQRIRQRSQTARSAGKSQGSSTLQ